MTLTAADLRAPGALCVHFAAEVPSAERIGAEASAHVAEIDGGAIESREDLMAAFASALAFPDYFGRNWDALDECLRDLTWIDAAGYVVVISGAEHLWRSHPRLAGNLVESWLLCAQSWSERGVPFHLVFGW